MTFPAFPTEVKTRSIQKKQNMPSFLKKKGILSQLLMIVSIDAIVPSCFKIFVEFSELSRIQMTSIDYTRKLTFQERYI
jgi:hypothetical protein